MCSLNTFWLSLIDSQLVITYLCNDLINVCLKIASFPSLAETEFSRRQDFQCWNWESPGQTCVIGHSGLLPSQDQVLYEDRDYALVHRLSLCLAQTWTRNSGNVCWTSKEMNVYVNVSWPYFSYESLSFFLPEVILSILMLKCSFWKIVLIWQNLKLKMLCCFCFLPSFTPFPFWGWKSYWFEESLV